MQLLLSILPLPSILIPLSKESR
ncbi:Protein of unknown function [Pyronema omphalodes CBS 100304]|uniref:Uncharacterized protein n=1 Tax=Pyronema omphalodes (strain CBS 100304) TaxID=1076935 RepID=U4KU51_PYROM|nr:Protein of unknown function [Pyronema omphalodes CBS 100304]